MLMSSCQLNKMKAGSQKRSANLFVKSTVIYLNLVSYFFPLNCDIKKNGTPQKQTFCCFSWFSLSILYRGNKILYHLKIMPRHEESKRDIAHKDTRCVTRPVTDHIPQAQYVAESSDTNSSSIDEELRDLQNVQLKINLRNIAAITCLVVLVTILVSIYVAIHTQERIEHVRNNAPKHASDGRSSAHHWFFILYDIHVFVFRFTMLSVFLNQASVSFMCCLSHNLFVLHFFQLAIVKKKKKRQRK